jgi:hypothetical protein
MATFIVYDTASGSPGARPILRWGSCAPDAIAAQAHNPGEVAVAADLTVIDAAGALEPDAARLTAFVFDPGTRAAAVIPPSADQVDALRDVAAAHAFLDDTDWYVVRQAETGVPVPTEITTTRAAARETISRRRGETA